MSEQHAPEKFEESDWEFRPVIISALSMLAFLALGLVLGYFTIQLVTVREDQAAEPPVFAQKHERPNPRLQTDEPGDLRDFRKKEDDQLSSYEMLDRTKGSVRIPIDLAIDLVANESGGTK